MSRYQQTAVPFNFADVRTWLALQLRNISDVLVAPEVNSVNFAVLNAEPTHRVDGDLVYADGTNWNPGSGRGLYERRSGAWVKL